MYNPRNSITRDGFDIIVDLDKLDLDYTPEITPPAWKPTKILKPYDSISKLYMDIETTGLDPMVCRVTFIGLKDECGVYKIFTNRDEEALLNEFMRWFYNNTPEALILHNGFNFDLPFLIKRFSKYQINHSFRMAEKTSTITASSFNGKPIEYTPVYWNSISIIDTFQQIAIWDKSAAKLEGYGLKNSVIALKLREDRRLELSNAEIQECWKNGDLGQIETYLRYDLDDTELLANFLLPIVWYQMAYVPNLSFQQLATASPALKAQKVHQELIGGFPEADEPMDFLGGGVELLLPGLHHDVAKIDVASLYPSLMLRYGLCSKKDPQHKFLGWIKYLVDERLRLKELAKNGDKVANHQQNAMKILVNGSYGFMGTSFYTYNDFEAAALVTAYGRKILALMHDTIVECGDKPIECDTDGIYYSSSNPDETFDKVSSVMPDGISLELEMKNCGIYAPKAKNYIIIHTETGKMTVKGMFRKRNRYPLDNEFPIEYIRKYFTDGKLEADNYFLNITENLEYGDFDLNKLTITRRIGKAEKTLVELGIGKIGEISSFWYAEDVRFHKRTGKALKSLPIPTNQLKYWPHYYVDRVVACRDDILFDHTKPIAPIAPTEPVEPVENALDGLLF